MASCHPFKLCTGQSATGRISGLKHRSMNPPVSRIVHSRLASANLASPSFVAPLHRTVGPFGSQQGERNHRHVSVAATTQDVPQDVEKQVIAASQHVEDRVVPIHTEDDLVDELEKAGDALVILEVMADEVCDSGMKEPDDGWQVDESARRERDLEKCTTIKHNFMLMAADSPDVRFLAMLGSDVDAERAEFSQRLGVTTYPTVFFFKNKEIIWSSSGSYSLEDDLKRGLLYFGDTAKAGLKGSENVRDLETRSDLDDFIYNNREPELRFLMVSAPFCSPCVQIYPSIVTLAMNFKGGVSFARLGDEESDEVEELFGELGILEVPTFISYVNGKEVARCVSSNKGELIGHILQVISQNGVAMPAM